MKITEKITSLFNGQATTSSYEENNVELSFTCTLIGVKTPSKTALEAIFDHISPRDSLKVSVFFDNSGNAAQLVKGKVDEFLSDFTSKLRIPANVNSHSGRR